MSATQKVRKKLQERKLELEQEITRLSREKVSDDQVQDPGDQAIASNMEDLNISLQNRELDEYARVKKALEMLDEGAYGICSDCGEPISEKRLALYPDATRCIVCQQAFEEQ